MRTRGECETVIQTLNRVSLQESREPIGIKFARTKSKRLVEELLHYLLLHILQIVPTLIGALCPLLGGVDALNS